MEKIRQFFHRAIYRSIGMRKQQDTASLLYLFMDRNRYRMRFSRPRRAPNDGVPLKRAYDGGFLVVVYPAVSR